jgi:hypothetical protein
MNKALRLWVLSFLGLTITLSLSPAAASPDTQPMIASGLWRIVSIIQGPWQQQSKMTQYECWNAQTGSLQAFLPSIGNSGNLETDNAVINSPHRTTVHLHSFQNLPNGTATQNITMIFSDNRSVLHRAIMSGSGRLTFSASPKLGDHFTQQGRWISATCPVKLPEANLQQLQKPFIPALQKLDALAKQLQAGDPDPTHQ